MTDRDKLMAMGFEPIWSKLVIDLNGAFQLYVELNDDNIYKVYISYDLSELDCEGITTPEQVRELIKFITGK